MSPRIAIVCCVVGVVIGVGATSLFTSSRGASPSETVVRRPDGERAHPLRIEHRTGAAAGEIRALVAEEVRAALREHAPATAASAGDPGAAAVRDLGPTPAFEQAKGRVADRVAQGAWTPSDRDWMRGVLGAVNDAERTELIGQLIAAANKGALRVELEGPLF
jgi:hypothetical protein